MLCDNCHKNKATIYYTETINGHRKDQHLCEECASGLSSFNMQSPFMSQDFTLGNLLSTVLGYPTSYTGSKSYTENDITCKNCGMTYSQFLRNGRFGCNHCYDYFEKLLDGSLKRIHGSDTHIGKRPHKAPSKVTKEGQSQKSLVKEKKEMSEIDQLSMKLQEAIKKEEYEEAAHLRDKIRELKKGKRQ